MVLPAQLPPKLWDADPHVPTVAILHPLLQATGRVSKLLFGPYVHTAIAAPLSLGTGAHGGTCAEAEGRVISAEKGRTARGMTIEQIEVPGVMYTVTSWEACSHR